jgi:hypothetical protein
MGSSFEDLVVRGSTMKTDYNFDKWFKSYDFLKKKSHDIKFTYYAKLSIFKGSAWIDKRASECSLAVSIREIQKLLLYNMLIWAYE